MSKILFFCFDCQFSVSPFLGEVTSFCNLNNLFPNLRRLPPVVVFLLRLFRPLLVKERFVGFGEFDALLPAERRGVMRLVPLTERRRVDGNDGVLDEGLGTHQLVVASVVDGVDDASFTGDRLRTPREIARVQSVKLVSKKNAHAQMKESYFL